MSVNSSRIDESMPLFVEQEMAGIHITTMGPDKAKVVEFLREHTDVSRVIVSEAGGTDLRD